MAPPDPPVSPALVVDIPDSSVKPSFPCSLCSKVCLTKRGGLSRHCSADHSELSVEGMKKKIVAEEMLDPLDFGAIAVSDPSIFIADRRLRLFTTSRLLHQLLALGKNRGVRYCNSALDFKTIC